MSAFIVEPKTINRIVTALRLGEFTYTKRRLVEAGFSTDPEALGRAMMDLNVDAVNQRYNENTKPSQIAYCYQPELCGQIQALKSLRCWIYQCSEGNVPEQKLYQIMDGFCQAQALRICSRLPEYETAEWD